MFIVTLVGIIIFLFFKASNKTPFDVPSEKDINDKLKEEFNEKNKALIKQKEDKEKQLEINKQTDIEQIKQQIKTNPDAFLKELAKKYDFKVFIKKD